MTNRKASQSTTTAQRARKAFLERPERLVGMAIVGWYPRHNIVGVKSQCEERRVKVERVRVIDKEPLDPVTLRENPLVNRGTVLVTGVDMDRGVERSFWLERFTNYDVVPYAAAAKAMAVGRRLAVRVEDGHEVRTVTIADPRSRFCETYGRMARAVVCYPISEAIFLAKANR